MKFSPADSTSGYVIHGYGEKELLIGETRYTRSLIIMPDKIIPEWRPQSPDQLQAEDFELLIEYGVDLIILGTGQRQMFPSPALYRSLIDAGTGFEFMTTPAACRTYNVLASEGRPVAAALILGN
ncbi:MAG: Xcc1710-like domain-containing protein [Gammaproteobacteria bacterium]|nr:Xcc1710-like domain-containing protein [Gammaproteobacteria bacterium]